MGGVGMTGGGGVGGGVSPTWHAPPPVALSTSLSPSSSTVVKVAALMGEKTTVIKICSYANVSQLHKNAFLLS